MNIESLHTSSEDALTFLMRASHRQSPSTLGEDLHGEEVLEVATVWEDTVLDVRHSRIGGAPVTVGSGTGHRWRLLGAPIAWVPPAFVPLAWLTAPTFSEVREEWQADLYDPNTPVSLPLLSWEASEGTEAEAEAGWVLVLRHRPEWVGFVDVGAERRSIAALPGVLEADTGLRRVELPLGGVLVLELGSVVVFAHRVRPGKRVLTPLSEQVDYPFLGVMALMGAALAMLSLLVALRPPAIDTTLVEDPEQFAALMLREPFPPEAVPLPSPTPEASREPEEGARAAEREGTVGRRDARQKEAKGTPQELDRRARDLEVATSAGVLGAFSDSGMLSGILGSSALGSEVMGGVRGWTGALGTQQGSGGLGRRGDWLGGGGRIEGGVGVGTRGRGGPGDGRYGAEGGTFGPRPAGTFSIPSEPILMGGMDQGLVDAVVKQHLQQIRYCYQRMLPQNPTLGGKVVVKFIIARDGSVSSSSLKSSTLGAPEVEQCITRRFLQMQFPEPQGGGIVIVSYPFLFTPG